MERKNESINRKTKHGERGGALLWVLLIVLVAAGIFAYLNRGAITEKLESSREKFVASRPASPKESPAPETSAPDSFPPSSSAPSSAAQGPAAPGSAAPGMQRREIDLNELARTPSRWPKTVTLTRPTEFPVMVNGRKAGSIVLPPGAKVKVVKIMGVLLEVESGGAREEIGASSTNLREIVNASAGGGA